ncbi:MAG: hypothetical protein RLZZ234_4 [Candidatus Parcubacteria bacterium]|jgi:hypothetical protein
MPDRGFINNFLKVNGISADSSDDDIRKVLDEAKWTEDEIKVALFILRADVDDSGIVALTKHDAALFRPDINIGSKHLSRLLGVDVVVDPSLIRTEQKQRAQKTALREELAIWTIIILLSVILALVVAWLLLFTMKIGPYREVTPWI